MSELSADDNMSYIAIADEFEKCEHMESWWQEISIADEHENSVWDLLEAWSESTISYAVEDVLPNGNYVAYACGPMMWERYINDKMEMELTYFKREVEKWFQKTWIDKEYAFPRWSTKVKYDWIIPSAKHGETTKEKPSQMMSEGSEMMWSEDLSEHRP